MRDEVVEFLEWFEWSITALPYKGDGNRYDPSELAAKWRGWRADAINQGALREGRSLGREETE